MNIVRYFIITLISIMFFSSIAFSDCVFGAKNKTKFTVLDSHRIILTGGFGSDILIKTYCFIGNSSSVSVLKDSFCSYESAVLYIDGQECDANNVTKLD